MLSCFYISLLVSLVAGDDIITATEHHGSTDGIAEEGDEMCSDVCSTWTVRNEKTGCCECGALLSGVIKCDSDNFNVSILSGYCMTYDSIENKTYLTICPYGSNVSQYLEKYYDLPKDETQLTSAMCDPFQRYSQACSKCKSGHGPGIFSADVNCYSCSGAYSGWSLYMVFELLPITIMFFILMVFQLRGSQEMLNAFLFFSQMITYIYQFTPPAGSYPFGKTSSGFITVFQVVYGIFNLDFFRKVVPPFCVSENINGLRMWSLLYVAVMYILLLIVITYILIELHANNCRFLVCIWRPIHKYYVKIHRNVAPQTTLIDAFATALILSYSRLMFISLVLLRPTPMYTPDGVTSKVVLYIDGSIDFLSAHHLPFVFLGIAIITTFNIIPVVFLFAYQTSTFQKLLGRASCKKLTRILHPFADVFQGCYKNGTNKTRDCRYFAGLYLLLRIVTCIGNKTTFFLGSLAPWIIPSVIFLITALLFANVRPYRSDIFNTMDSLWFSLAVIFCIIQTIITAKGVESSNTYQIIAQMILVIPLIYIVSYLIYVVIIRRFLKRRRKMNTAETSFSRDLSYRMMQETT